VVWKLFCDDLCCDVRCSSCSRDTVREHVLRYLADSIQQQQRISDIVLRQFNDAFLDQCVNSITVYDLSPAIQVCTVINTDLLNGLLAQNVQTLRVNGPAKNR